MADYIKTLTTTCHGALLEAINALSGIAPDCVQLIDTDDGNITFQFDGDLSGAEDTTLDSFLSTWSCPAELEDGETRAFTDTSVYESEEEKTFILPWAMPLMIMHVTDPTVTELVGASLVSPSGTGWDPGNVSTGEANINNGVPTDLCYNNSAIGATEGVILGIDMGSPTEVSAMSRYDYNISYYDTSWEFIGTNDATGATYTVIFSHTQSAANLNPDPYFTTFTPATFRYFGCRCVKSFNASYTIISELELYSGGTVVNVEKKLSEFADYSFAKISNTEVAIKNLASRSRTLKTIILGT